MWRALRPTYEPQLAATYEDVRRHVQEQSFDAVVMSLYPFDVDEGIQVVEDVRAKAAHAECPIIAVCHPSVEAESESLRQAGFDDVVRMPFGQSELLAVLDRHLGAA
jgi:DNA-binding response OmpR family regulator